jgi:hypothetical protein
MQQIMSSSHRADVVQSSEWELLPSDLRTHINDWRSACEIAKESSAKESPWSEADVSYWDHQLKVLEAIELLLGQAKLNASVLNWTSVDDRLPCIKENLITNDEVYLVKHDGRVMAAKLYAGKPVPNQDAWQCDKDGMKERHWVSLHEDGSIFDRILSQVTEWSPMPH